MSGTSLMQLKIVQKEQSKVSSCVKTEYRENDKIMHRNQKLQKTKYSFRNAECEGLLKSLYEDSTRQQMTMGNFRISYQRQPVSMQFYAQLMTLSPLKCPRILGLWSFNFMLCFCVYRGAYYGTQLQEKDLLGMVVCAYNPSTLGD